MYSNCSTEFNIWRIEHDFDQLNIYDDYNETILQ
jgi:hypothetical protein